MLLLVCLLPWLQLSAFECLLILLLCLAVPTAVCASAGDVAQAFAVFQRAKAAQQQLAAAAAAAGNAADAPRLDSHLYGALIAACAQGIKSRSSDRKDQLVILDRAFQVLQDAMDCGVHLETPVWNALLMCAGEFAVVGGLTMVDPVLTMV
jgi:hypothetical protein